MFRFITGQLVMALETNCIVKYIIENHHVRNSSRRLLIETKLVHLDLSIPLNKYFAKSSYHLIFYQLYYNFGGHILSPDVSFISQYHFKEIKA